MSQYIGVTGFTSRKNLLAVCYPARIPERSLESPFFMAGVLASTKTLRGVKVESRRYPPVDAIADIFSITQDFKANCLRLIHFNSRAEGRELIDELLRIRKYGGEHCDGLQLNMALPAIEVLEGYREKYPHDSVVLQINNFVFGLAENDPKKITQIVTERYERHLCTHVLLDKSGGTKKRLDLVEMDLFVDALTQKGIMAVGIAGGISPENVEDLEWFIQAYPHLSIDAEGALHSGEHKDIFEPKRAVEYINTAFQIYESLE